MSEIRRGDKVCVPRTKSVYGSHANSSVIKEARCRGQNFLYFVGYRREGSVMCLNYFNSAIDGGDYFSTDEVFAFKENRVRW